MREIRALYDEHQRARAEHREPSLAVNDIAKLFGVHWTTIVRIGRRVQRYDVPEEAVPGEGRSPRKPHPRTLKRRAAQG